MNLVLALTVLLASSIPVAAAAVPAMVTIEVEMTKDEPAVSKHITKKHVAKSAAKPYRYTEPPHRRLLPK